MRRKARGRLDDGLGGAEQRGDTGAEDDGRDQRPPAAVADDGVEAARMPGGEQPFERLLRDEDPVEAERGRRPQPAERAPRPARRAAGARARDSPQEQADGEAEQQDEPRRERVDVAVPLRGQLGVRLLAVRERVAQLVHDERDGGQQQKAAPGEGVCESARRLRRTPSIVREGAFG